MDSLRGLVGAVRRRPKTGLLVVAVCLSAAASASADPFGRASASRDLNVERGDRGAAVERVQRALGVRPIDGVFGPVTERAVRRFVAGSSSTGSSALSRSVPSGSLPAAARRKTWPAAFHDALRLIAECESGGNPRAVSAGGRYRGKYQFTRAVPSAEQEIRGCPGVAAGSPGAEALSAQRRCSWPACA